MAKQVILAVAGSGKTYHICHSINLQEKNLILAYTHENLRNIRKELVDANGGHFPELTNVMTFDSFLYGYIVQPYEPTILTHFGYGGYCSNGITLKDPPRQQIKVKGRYIPNPHYYKKETIWHYVTSNGYYYCATLAELIMEVKQKKDSLIKRVAKKMREFYDRILVDEFQDFREYDYDLICNLAQYADNVTLVGDFYQHSVSANNNTGRPFANKKIDVSYNDFVNNLIKNDFSVDEKTLEKSRRCSKEVCEFISQKLKINIVSAEINQGIVNWVKEAELEDVLNNSHITKLVFNNSLKYKFNAVNWSYSKGDTMGEVCVILTDGFEKLDQLDFDISKIGQSSINKLYVALSRTKGNLHLVKKSVFDKVKTNYEKR